MTSWRSVLALSVVGAMLATTALAQGTGSGGGKTTSPQMGAQEPKPSGTTADPAKPDAAKPDAAKPDSSMNGTGSTSPSGTTADTGKSDKSDMMKSGRAPKSDQAGKAGGRGEQVRAAQQALKDKGHDPGTIDGVMGAKTQAALRDFQKKEGLKETGRLDAETMAKLGVEAKTGQADTSSPAASPKTGADAKDSAAKDKANGKK